MTARRLALLLALLVCGRPRMAGARSAAMFRGGGEGGPELAYRFERFGA